MHVLGSISQPERVASPWVSVNGRGRRPFSLGPDLHRLADAGDFTLELDRRSLRAGEGQAGRNTLTIGAWTLTGEPITTTVQLQVAAPREWPLPYAVDFRELAAADDEQSAASRLQSVVEVVDGRWELTAEGVRTAAPYYDRVLAFGDGTWRDYELRADVVINRLFPSRDGRRLQGPPYLSHVHTSFNLRWAGYPNDGFQPRRDWQAIGALVALRSDWPPSELALGRRDAFWWMHYGRAAKGRGKTTRSQRNTADRLLLPEGEPLGYRLRVQTLDESTARYAAKVWPLAFPEPDDWQMTGVDEAEAIASGCVAFVVHHSDATLQRIEVQPLGKPGE